MQGPPAFPRAVYRDWVALASSVAFVLLAVGGQLSATSLPPWAFRTAAVISLLIAASRTWQLKHREAMRVAKRHQDQSLAGRLAEYLEPAHEILNRQIKGGDEFRQLMSDHHSWVAALLLTMTERGCSTQEIRTIKEVNRFEIRHYSDDPVANQEKSILCERIARLKRVIDSHRERPMPVESVE